MSRIKDLQKYIHKTLGKSTEDPKEFAKWIAHLHGVALAAAMIAQKRGEDPEIATMAGLLHDVEAYKAGSYDDHAHLGAELAKKILEELEVTTPEETAVIYSAIYHHDDKENHGSPMDEILKDADVIHHTLNDPSKAVKDHEKERYSRLCEEFGLIIEAVPVSI